MASTTFAAVPNDEDDDEDALLSSLVAMSSLSCFDVFMFAWEPSKVAKLLLASSSESPESKYCSFHVNIF